MDTLALPEISAMDEVISDLRCLHFAYDQKQLEYGKAAVIRASAWDAFGRAVDDGQPAAEINRLGDIAEVADSLLLQARNEFDAAKIAILVRES
jgi:hypothetical protein